MFVPVFLPMKQSVSDAEEEFMDSTVQAKKLMN